MKVEKEMLGFSLQCTILCYDQVIGKAFYISFAQKRFTCLRREILLCLLDIFRLRQWSDAVMPNCKTGGLFFIDELLHKK